MTTHIAHGAGAVIDVVTFPHTTIQAWREVRSGEIHLTIKERLWLWAYPKEFFCDRPRWLWGFLLEVFA